MLPVRAILHPTDFSAQADDAYRTARRISREFGRALSSCTSQRKTTIGPNQPCRTEFGIAFGCIRDSRNRRGSLVAEAVIGKAQCPLLTVRSPAAESSGEYGVDGYEVVTS